MSHDNVELIQHAFAAWNRGDVEWLVANADPEIEITSLTSEVRGEPYRGHDGVRQWFADTHDAFAVVEPRPEDLRAIGDFVVVSGIIRWQGKDSGIEMVNQAVAWVWTLRDAKVLRGEIFTDRDQALQAVGLAQ